MDESVLNRAEIVLIRNYMPSKEENSYNLVLMDAQAYNKLLTILVYHDLEYVDNLDGVDFMFETNVERLIFGNQVLTTEVFRNLVSSARGLDEIFSTWTSICNGDSISCTGFTIKYFGLPTAFQCYLHPDSQENSVIKVTMPKALPIVLKGMTLIIAAKLCVIKLKSEKRKTQNWSLVATCLPNFKESQSFINYIDQILVKKWHHLLNRKLLNFISIRAAGYKNSPCIEYYKIISCATKETVLTFEKHQSRSSWFGKLKDNYGHSLFVLQEVTDKDEIVVSVPKTTKRNSTMLKIGSFNNTKNTFCDNRGEMIYTDITELPKGTSEMPYKIGEAFWCNGAIEMRMCVNVRSNKGRLLQILMLAHALRTFNVNWNTLPIHPISHYKYNVWSQ